MQNCGGDMLCIYVAYVCSYMCLKRYTFHSIVRFQYNTLYHMTMRKSDKSKLRNSRYPFVWYNMYNVVYINWNQPVTHCAESFFCAEGCCYQHLESLVSEWEGNIMPAVKRGVSMELYVVLFGFGEGIWGLFWIETPLSGIHFCLSVFSGPSVRDINSFSHHLFQIM